MTWFVALLVFGFLYLVGILITFVFIVMIGDLFFSTLTELNVDSQTFKGLYAILFVCMATLASLRAKLAANAYGERQIGFWEAHRQSGVMLRVYLSFLPWVGKFFNKKNLD